MSEKYYLSRTDDGRVYLAPSRRKDAMQECEVSAAFVLRHLNRLPEQAHRFTENDQSFPALCRELAGGRI